MSKEHSEGGGVVELVFKAAAIAFAVVVAQRAAHRLMDAAEPGKDRKRRAA